VEPLTKAAESLGIETRSLLFFYVFAVFVVGAPATALFLKRGVAASLDDGRHSSSAWHSRSGPCTST
jgi:hypothetical protein